VTPASATRCRNESIASSSASTLECVCAARPSRSRLPLLVNNFLVEFPHFLFRVRDRGLYEVTNLRRLIDGVRIVFERQQAGDDWARQFTVAPEVLREFLMLLAEKMGRPEGTIGRACRWGLRCGYR